MACETLCKGTLLHTSKPTPCYIYRTSRFEFKKMELTFCVKSLAVIDWDSVNIQ